MDRPAPGSSRNRQPAPARTGETTGPGRKAAEGANGFVLVSSTPSKLVIAVDDRRVDVSPAKLELAPGSHEISLLHENEVVYRATVQVRSGEVATVSPELTAAIARAARSNAAPGGAGEGRTGTALVPPGPERPVPPLGDRSRPSGEPAAGEIHVVSSNIQGEVYVNGIAHGLTPRVVRDVPAGVARVEVRVQGHVMRKRAVLVRPGKRSQVVFW
jgi:hypothetical protein